MITAEQLEAIWPVGWRQDPIKLDHSAQVQGVNVRVVKDSGVYVAGVAMQADTLRRRLEAARAEVLRCVQPIPGILPEPAMIDRLEAMLKPLGWRPADPGDLRWSHGKMHMLLRYAGNLNYIALRLQGDLVREDELARDATDEQIRTVLSRLLDFPRWP